MSEVGFKVTRVDEMCRDRGPFGLFGVCGARKVRVEITEAAANELRVRGLPVPDVQVLCINPRSACGVKNLGAFRALGDLL